MKQQYFFSFSLVILFLHCTNILAQIPAAAPAQGPVAASPPAPPVTSQPPAASPAQPSSVPAPTNVTKILEKAGHFTVFIRLLKSTQEENHLLTVLNNSNNGLTIFAPTDGAFSTLKSGTLNSLTEEQKSELVKFHVVPSFLSTSQFQTVSNPVGTEAGAGGRVALNFTAFPNSVIITTGLTNTSISGTVYSDNQLAVYRVDKVLLPMDIFTPNAPAPAPAVPEKKPKKETPDAAVSPIASTTTTPTTAAAANTSGAMSCVHNHGAILGVLGIVAAILSL
ncbi:fasciclin-like arabinogalactan protein 12 [Ricinus communis]|uniref:FAS1 domain-containing protein n=1 Tax=Ricinus communis TaxID=3988 RepID=B9T2Z2_RICCO|nr:fasciclin-like arabinogalactan protein 12 [Ricinus communis]EEF29777.1 conserved hypothetical protein [Ricinus communis]|eukprot:XP_002532611.1 fasciclin-like arabinogalactan protein 12 [Ricinus communis]